MRLGPLFSFFNPDPSKLTSKMLSELVLKNCQVPDKSEMKRLVLYKQPMLIHLGPIILHDPVCQDPKS